MVPSLETSDPHDKVYQECIRRFKDLTDGQKEIADGQKDIIKLLRGDGPDPGLVGDVRSHSEYIAELRQTLYGDEPGTGMTYTVQQLARNGTSRISAEREKRTIVYGILSKLATAAIIALAAWLLSLYRWGGALAGRAEVAPPAAAEAAQNRPAQPDR